MISKKQKRLTKRPYYGARRHAKIFRGIQRHEVRRLAKELASGEGGPSGIEAAPMSIAPSPMPSGEGEPSGIEVSTTTEVPTAIDAPSRPPRRRSAVRRGMRFPLVETASARKLSSPGPSSPTGESYCLTNERDCERRGNRIVSMSNLADVVSELTCPDCESCLGLVEKMSVRRGLVTSLSFQCTGCTWTRDLSDPASQASKALNDRSILGSRLCGRGRSGIESVCAMLNLPPPLSTKSFSSHAERISTMMKDMVEAQMKLAARNLKKQLKSDPDEVMNVCVTCDCTWSKRGFTAPYGVVVVISWDSGEVLDFEILNKHCRECDDWSHADVHSDQYKQWYEGHKDHCERNCWLLSRHGG